jgi:hypothetical protein
MTIYDSDDRSVSPSTVDLSRFSRLHKRVVWQGLLFTAPLPGLFFLMGFEPAGMVVLLVLCLLGVIDPLLRLLLRHYGLVRHLTICIIAIYFVAALLWQLIPLLTLPFLIGSLLIMLIWFSRRTRDFERQVLGVEPLP